MVELFKGYNWVVHFSILSFGTKVRGSFPNPWGLCVVAMGEALTFMLWNVVLFLAFDSVHETWTTVIIVFCFGCQN